MYTDNNNFQWLNMMSKLDPENLRYLVSEYQKRSSICKPLISVSDISTLKDPSRNIPNNDCIAK